ncbi:MAG: AAA family ATPase [Isosphaeraceae bacterium]
MTLRNVLSFGPEGQTLDFEPLNVFIGANGSGKTNLLEIVSLLKALPDELHRFLKEWGGLSEWIWKGDGANERAEITTEWDVQWQGVHRVAHHIEFSVAEHRLEFLKERITEFTPEGEELHFDREGSKGRVLDASTRVVRTVNLTDQAERSVLATLRDPERYPALDALQRCYSSIRSYRRWTFGPGAPARRPVRVDVWDDAVLEENQQNLASILQGLLHPDRHEVREKLLTAFRRFYGDDSEPVVKEPSRLHLDIAVKEASGFETPALRVSDGTLHFLSLLAILLNPEPASLVCLEEPELGLHPDAVRLVAEVLRDACEDKQLLITTHSADLISGLGDVPEAVATLEREVDRSVVNRLSPARLELWLERYTLGDLWLSGEIGGTRW